MSENMDYKKAIGLIFNNPANTLTTTSKDLLDTIVISIGLDLEKLEETKKELEEVKAERDELRELATELIKADGKSYVGAFNNLAENLGLKGKMI